MLFIFYLSEFRFCWLKLATSVPTSSQIVPLTPQNEFGRGVVHRSKLRLTNSST